MSTKNTVLLFAGQGAQVVGMASDLVDRFPVAARRLEQADNLLGFSLSEIMFNGPSTELTRTSRCQPALFVHGIICLEILRELVPNLRIGAVAGLSLGEFTAHAAAGTFDFETGLDLVAKRGRFMEEATNATDGTMAAMMGGDEAKVRELAEVCDVDVANYNAPGQIVISGSRSGVAKAVSLAKDYGIRIAKELDVAGAYHSRLMTSAQEKLEPELTALELKIPRIPVISNVTAKEVSSPEQIRETLTDQVSGSVRWSDCVQNLLDRGFDEFVEIGPGGVLSGLMKRIDRNATITCAHDAASIETIASRFLDNAKVAVA